MHMCGTKLQGKQEASSLSSEINQENERCNCRCDRLLKSFSRTIAFWSPEWAPEASCLGEGADTAIFFATHVVGMSHPYTQFVHSSVVVTGVSPATDQNHENRTLGSRIALSNSHVFIHLTIHTHHTCSSTYSSLQISRGPKREKLV